MSHAHTTPNDHADDHAHHGHTIVPMRVLVGVLAILLFFTVATVLAANAEQLFARLFDVHIPGWINALVALSIAAVKSVIVAMYFMQLRYDHNPFNALVAVFTIMVLTFFLGFTALDLGNRNALYDYKADEVIAGGTGGINKPLSGGASKEIVPANKSIAAHAREKADAQIDSLLAEGKVIENHALTKRLYIRYHELIAGADPAKAEAAARMKAYMEKHTQEFDHIAHGIDSHGGLAKYIGQSAAEKARALTRGPERSSGSVARPRSGVTLPEFGGAAAAPHGH